VWYAGQYLNTGGHPPASGIVALIAVLIAAPFAVLAVLLSIFGVGMSSVIQTRTYLACLGIHVLFLILASQIIF